MSSIADTSVSATFLATLNKALNLPGTGASASVVYNKAQAFDDGTGDGQCNQLFTDQRTLANGANESLDLSGVALQNPLGENIAFTKVKVILIAADAGNTDNIQVGGAATPFAGPFVDGATDKIKIAPGGMAMFMHPGAGWTVGAGATDLFKVENMAAGATAVYDIMLLGVA